MPKICHPEPEYMNPHYISLGTNHTEYYTIYNYILRIYMSTRRKLQYPSIVHLPQLYTNQQEPDEQ